MILLSIIGEVNYLSCLTEEDQASYLTCLAFKDIQLAARQKQVNEAKKVYRSKAENADERKKDMELVKNNLNQLEAQLAKEHRRQERSEGPGRNQETQWLCGWWSG